MYPALAQLEDEGLIRSEEIDGRKLFALTDDGSSLIAERPADRPAPWEEMSGAVSDRVHELGGLLRDVAHALRQVMRTGSESQVATAVEVLVRTRKDLYLILAEGEGDADTVSDEG